MKISIAQITTDPACFDSNLEKICAAIDKAKTGSADLVIFPELALPGYACMDLMKKESFLNNNQSYLEKLSKYCENIAVIIGFVEKDPRQVKPDSSPVIYNSAAIIDKGEVKNIVRKQLLPSYDIFYEGRYFTPGQNNSVVEIANKKFGIGICEDLWNDSYQKNVYQELIEQGAEILINLSASPYEPGKQNRRIQQIEKVLGEHPLPFIYVNLVGGFDCYDGEIVFDGQSLARGSNGKFYQFGKSFAEDFYTIDLDQDPEHEYNSTEDLNDIYQALVLGIKEYFRRTRMQHAHIGLSGGIDSALTICLAVDALGPENVTAITMPSHITSDQTLGDAENLAKNLKVKLEKRPIKEIYNAWIENFKTNKQADPESISKQNIQARIRGMILMEYTNQNRKGLVISTGNKTELALGYCTMYGDMCGGLAAISDLSKIKVYELSEFYNQNNKAEIIPQSIIDRVPTAELEENQKDSDNLPADYDVLSPLVDDIVDHCLSKKELYKKYDQEIVDQTLKLININEFKRRQAAPGIRVSKRAFGIGRRIPITHGL